MNNKLYITMRPVMGNINKTGKCVIRCRITYNKQRKEFSTGLFVFPKHWNRKKQKVLNDSENSEYINTQLGLIINKMNQAFLLLKFKKVVSQLMIFTPYIKVINLKKNTIQWSTSKCS